jgi:hypothetical protein
MVTGGDALVLVEVDAPLDPSALVLTAAGTDVSGQLHPYDTPERRIARLEGLPLGPTDVVATVASDRDTLTLVNHPIAGTVFSGPHETPFVCTTMEFFLGPPLDEDCSAPTVVAWFYKGTDGALHGLMDPTATPADIATTTTRDGRTIPYVVRVEVGTINRAIYWIASPYDRDAPPWEPWQTNPAWNGKVFYEFGGGCGPGYVQGDPFYALINTGIFVLDQGHAVLHSSLNTLGNNCNDVLSAETAMMVKEHFVESFGVPIYTMGWGGSGGSIQQHLIADNYPGILDGLLPSASYPDIWSIFPDIVDCRLLLRYFERRALLWPDTEARRAVTGYAALGTCMAWEATFTQLIDPRDGCDARVPASAVYQPGTNPEGARCTVQDHMVNIFGRDPATGFARRPYDNAGVQYGLQALRDGAISPAQFLDLNERVGGFDIDGNLVAERTVADAEAIRIAYATGRVTSGRHLGAVPIVDLRPYLDPAGDIHDAFRTLSTRERLIAANGDALNHVTFIAPFSMADPAPLTAASIASYLVLDEWLVALAADPDPDRHAAVRRTRPAGLGDRCYETATHRDGLCPETFPMSSSPRRTAGAPLANDIIQCALAPIDPADYPGFSTADLDRLRTIFPDGVCDWSAPPPNRAPPAGPWQTFGD